MRPHKFVLFGNSYQAKKSAHVLRLLSILEKYQAEVYIHKEFHQFLTKAPVLDAVIHSSQHPGGIGNGFLLAHLGAAGA